MGLAMSAILSIAFYISSDSSEVNKNPFLLKTCHIFRDWVIIDGKNEISMQFRLIGDLLENLQINLFFSISLSPSTIIIAELSVLVENFNHISAHRSIFELNVLHRKLVQSGFCLFERWKSHWIQFPYLFDILLFMFMWRASHTQNSQLGHMFDQIIVIIFRRCRLAIIFWYFVFC